jgi:hypothetical protein
VLARLSYVTAPPSPSEMHGGARVGL